MDGWLLALLLFWPLVAASPALVAAVLLMWRAKTFAELNGRMTELEERLLRQNARHEGDVADRLEGVEKWLAAWPWSPAGGGEKP